MGDGKFQSLNSLQLFAIVYGFNNSNVYTRAKTGLTECNYIRTWKKIIFFSGLGGIISFAELKDTGAVSPGVP